MTPDEFRATVLAAPGVTEGSHGGHADFRLGGKVIASLGHPDAGSAMVKLATEDQEVLVTAEPGTFRPAAGAWGRSGSTLVRLDRLDRATADSLLRMALRNRGPA